MKKISFAAFCCLLLFSFQSCLKDKLTHTYTIYTPIYETKEQAILHIKSNPAEEIGSPGNLFIYGRFIFLNEVDKGVHIIDNADPANPVDKAFIDIPGNLNIAVKGNILYADMYQDLVAIDISDPLNAKLIKTLPGIFPERYYAGGFVADNAMVIVGWTKTETTDELKPSKNYLVYPGTAQFDAVAGNSAASKSIPGISGSMASFTIMNDYMYAVDHHTLRSISISDPANPAVSNEIFAGFDIETIYPFKDKLFLGSMEGLFIYDVSQPAAPVKQGEFNHGRACDPVIADDDYAYVTLRQGTYCGGADNELDVVNIHDLQSPLLLKTYQMTNPHGLTKDNNLLFICDGTDGLKMYDATDPSNIVLKKHIGGLETSDAIAWNKNLIVVAKDGLYQYDYSNTSNLTLRSKLTINR